MPTPSNTNTTTETHDTADVTSPAAQVPGQQHTAGVAVNAQIPPLPALTQLGDPKRLLWLGGLVAVGALGVLEWPVVAAVGVGSYVAEQFAKNDTRPGQQHSQL